MALIVISTKILKQTIVAPTGSIVVLPVEFSVSINVTEKTKPMIKVSTEIAAELITTALKFLNNLIAVTVGTTIIADIIMAPTSFIPTTTVTAIRTDKSILNALVLTPHALAKDSSKVMAKMRL